MFAHQHSCPWDGMTCALAAKYGHLHLLMYARANGCPWDGWTCRYAAQNGHLNVLQYARENNCPEFLRTKMSYDFALKEDISRWNKNAVIYISY